jgi:predicted S18 family serine protease
MPEKINYLILFLLGVAFSAAIFLWVGFIEEKNPLENPKFEQVQKSVPIVAVSSDESQGYVGMILLQLIPGNSDVLIDTNPFLEPDLQYSANTAIAVAKLVSENNATNRDFLLIYRINATVIGGGSAGAVTTIAAIAALENKDIMPGVAMTGTIDTNGNIGQVGDVLQKAKAIADSGFTTFLVPAGQSKVTYYETVEINTTSEGIVMHNRRYVPRVLDLKETASEEWNLTVIEVSNIYDAMKYMIKT